MKNPPELVIWDIDGTLVRPSLESQFISFLQTQRLVSPWRMVGRMLRLSLRWSPPHWHEIKLAYVRGESEARVQEWVERWWELGGKASLLPGAARTIEILREHGVRQLLLSGTADFLALRLARHFELGDVVAGESLLVEGRYTGALTGPHPRGPQKVATAALWLKRHRVNWQDVVALGDHKGDALLMSQTGRAMAVNPRPALAREAEFRGWPRTTDGELPDALLKWL